MCDRQFTIQLLAGTIVLTTIGGAWMALTAGLGAPLWVPVTATCFEFLALDELISNDWFFW